MPTYFPQRGDLVHKPETGAYGYLSEINEVGSKIGAEVQMYSKNRQKFTSSKLRWSGDVRETLDDWVHSESGVRLDTAISTGFISEVKQVRGGQQAE